MLKYVIWVSVAWAILDAGGSAAASPGARNRLGRMLWPFSSSSSASASDEPFTSSARITKENAQLLEKAGLGKTFDLSSHPVWRIHKFQGIDLKPVSVDEYLNSEELNSDQQQQQPLDNAVVDKLMALSALLPVTTEPENPEQLENQHFLKRLWYKASAAKSNLLSSLVSLGLAATESDDAQPDSKALRLSAEELSSRLPANRGSYTTVILPQQPAVMRIEPRQPVAASSYDPSSELMSAELVSNLTMKSLADAVVQAQNPEGFGQPIVVMDPVEVPADFGNEQQAYVNYWSPNAAYNVNLQQPQLQKRMDVGPSDDEQQVVTAAVKAHSSLDVVKKNRTVAADVRSKTIKNETVEEVQQTKRIEPAEESEEEEEGAGEEPPEVKVERENSEQVAEEVAEVKDAEAKTELPPTTRAPYSPSTNVAIQRTRQILSRINVPGGVTRKMTVPHREGPKIEIDPSALIHEFQARREKFPHLYTRIQ